MPKTAPDTSLSAAREASPSEQPWWAAKSNPSHPLRRHWKLPLAGALLASAMLPLGVWSPSELSARAQESAPVAAGSEASSPRASSPRASGDTSSTSIGQAQTPSTSAVAPEESESKSALRVLTERATEALLQPKVSWNVRAIVGGKSLSQRVEVPSKGATVGQVLKAMNVSLGPLDRVFPLASTSAYPNIAIRVRRVEAPLRKRTERVPFETRYMPTATIRPGGTGVVQSGRSGVIEVTERLWSIDGKVSRREFVSRRLVRNPQPRVVGLGSRSTYVPSRIPYHNRYARAYGLSSRGGSARDRYLQARRGVPGGKTLRAVRMVELVATGYSPDPRENGGYTVTATGLPIGYGAAAVDPRVIPLGTKLYVEGYGYAFACDVGGAIKGRRIDLAYNSYYEANTKGRKKVRVWILAD